MTLSPDDVPPPQALGVVVEADRGSLPFSLVHGESLVACAAWALADAGVTVVDASVTWAGIREAEEPFVLHDALCPLTPAGFIAECVRVAVADDVVVVGVRAVTDTVKVVADGLVGATVDRTGLVEVWSPIVLPASTCAALEAQPGEAFAGAAVRLREVAAVKLVDAPPAARRVASADDLLLLEALTVEPGGPRPGPGPPGR